MPLELTTTFTPAASCLSSTYYFEEDGSARVQLGPPSTSDCLPSSYQADPSFYYSPGVFPWGYTTACWSMTTNDDSIRETVATCCPRNFACMTTVSHGWDFQSTLPCESHYPDGTTTVTVTALISGITSLTARTVSTLDAVNNYGVIIRRQASDNFAATTTPTATSLTPEPTAIASPATPTMTSGPAVTVSPVSSPSPSSSSSSGSGLSTGAKAGIGIGAAAAVLLMVVALALGFLIGRRRRRERNCESSGVDMVDVQDSKIGERLPSVIWYGNYGIREDRARVELSDGRDVVHELEGEGGRGK